MLGLLIVASCAIVLFVTLIWLLYLRFKNPSIIDGCWSLGILLAGSIYLFFQTSDTFTDFKPVLAWTLLLIWAMRLGGYIWVTRIIKNMKDPRYEAISSNWRISKKVGFLLNYLLQGLLMLIVALPFLSLRISTYQQPYYLDCIALVMVMIGILGESVADWQLSKFKRQASGRVCNRGLWAYSRHPNYFFELVIWFGFALLAWSPHFYGWLSLVSPLLLLFIFVFITGPITEQHMLRSKGDMFKAYQKSTSFIVPWPQRASIDKSN